VFLLIGLGHHRDRAFPATPSQLRLAHAEGPTQKAATQPATGAHRQPSFSRASPTRRKAVCYSDAYLAGLDKKQVELRIKRTDCCCNTPSSTPTWCKWIRQLEQLRIERRRYLPGNSTKNQQN